MNKISLTADTKVTVSLGFLCKFSIIIVLLHTAPELASHISG